VEPRGAFGRPEKAAFRTKQSGPRGLRS
jgi:hypothetical protein